METFWILSLALILIATCVRWYKTTHNLPPGPWNVPIIGYLAWLNPQFPYLTLMDLAHKYGPIYGLYLGSIYTVVVTDVKLIKKIFNKDVASGRAPLHLTHGIMKGFGLICAEGDLWKDQRKFVHTTLRMMGASRVSPNKPRMQNLITRNVLDLVQFLKSQDSSTLDPLAPLRHSLGSTINELVFGKSWPRDDETWKWLQHLQEEGTKHIGVAGPLNFLPFLRFLPKYHQIIKFLLDGKHKTHKIYERIIEEQKSKTSDNFISAFLAERERRDDGDKEEFYNDEQFHHLLADVFGASLDTTLTTLRWYLLYVALNQDVQDKIRESLDDTEVSVYLEASIAEAQRIRSVVPVGIPHGTMGEVEIDGFRIPKGTMVVPLQWAIHMDPGVWEEPERFRPERFIDEEGKFFKPEAFIPFQVGKRMCVGDELAKMILLLYGAILIKNFKISCTEDISVSGHCGITLTPQVHELTFTSLFC